MPTLQIADKLTLDSINNKIDNITSSLSAISEKVNNSGGAVKSVQRGTTNVSTDSGGQGSATVNITTVNTTKSFLLVSGASSSVYTVETRGVLGASSITLYAGGSTNKTVSISWQVVEFY